MNNELKYNGSAYKLIFFHIIAIISLFLIKKINIKTIIFQCFIYYLCMISITGGYHRLWTHKSYKASNILQIFYMLFGTAATQKSVFWWAKAHRSHHRNEEKSGDPYNINKGLFYAHIGWLLDGCDEETINEINKTNIDDLLKNKLLFFQEKNYVLIWLIILIILIIIPVLFWKENIRNSIFSNFIRIVLVLHSTYCVNSLAHYIGDKKFNKDLEASDNLFVSILTMGEGWHNYHHSYPKDYRSSEKGKYNPTTSFIDFTKKMNLSSDHFIKKNKKINHNNRFNYNNYKKST